MRNHVRALASLLEILEVALCTAGLVAILCLVAANVFMRYVLNAPLTWSHEIIMYAFILSSLMGISVAYRRQKHLQLQGLLAVMPVALGRIVQLAVLLIVLVLLVFLTTKAIDLNSLYLRFFSPLNRMPRSWLTMGLIWSLCSMSISTIYFMAELLGGGRIRPIDIIDRLGLAGGLSRAGGGDIDPE